CGNSHKTPDHDDSSVKLLRELTQNSRPRRFFRQTAAGTHTKLTTTTVLPSNFCGNSHKTPPTLTQINRKNR
ncbi:hypothetical protein, partial [Leptospira gomenensis]|uniref:hypothetical protein n=1 Tax=Leptospira gomenensis TaxID=2484974 RepID=UPI001AEFA7FB